MNFREKMKRFWTLDVHNHEGFTLVELIIVIAILAILSTGAIAGYSVYVEQASKQADETLMVEIANALNLAIYHQYDHEFTSGVAVIISSAGNAVVKSDSDNAADKKFVEDAMLAAFGSNWESVCKLQYDGWQGGVAQTVAAYKGSNFAGNEHQILDRVSVLTSAISSAVGDGIGDEEYNKLLDKYGATTPTEAGNAAVLYVANEVSSLSATQAETVKQVLREIPQDYNGTVNTTVSKLVNAMGGEWKEANTAPSQLLSAYALVYAYTEGFCGYIDKEAQVTSSADVLLPGTQKFYGEGSAFKKLEVLSQLFADVNTYAGTYAPTATQVYMSNSDEANAMENNINAIVAMMGAVSQSGDTLAENFGSEDCYSDDTVVDLLNGYITLGSVNIADGEAAVIINPNKSIVTYLGSIRK